MRIRTATPEDAEAIAAVQVASMQATYRGVIADDVLDGHDLAANRLGLWQRLLGDGAPAGHVAWVAEPPAGGVVAFADVLPSRDDDADAGTGEVPMIYARPEAWGSGAGRELMTTAVDALRGAGFRSVTLWVLDSNARARRFCERADFTPDGATKSDTFVGASITEVRYRRQL